MKSTLKDSAHPAYLSFYNILIGIFFIGFIFTEIHPIISRVILISGVGLVVLFLLIVFFQKVSIAPELAIYGIFLLWASVVGFLIAIRQSAFRDSISTLYQLFALMLTVSTIVKLNGNIKTSFIILIICTFILNLYVVINGDFRVSEQIMSANRQASLLSNPNLFAFFNLMSIAFLFFFAPKWQKTMQKIFGALLGFSNIVFILYSSSVKTFLGVIVLIFCWFWFCVRKQKERRHKFLQFLVLLILFTVMVSFTLSDTFLGVRLMNSASGNEASVIQRQILYREGWEIFLKYPIHGVGINNFQYYSSIHQVTHSDLLEVLTTTGIIGLILYLLIYVTLWNRLDYIARFASDREVIYQQGLYRAILITLFFIGLGRTNFNTIETMFILSSMIGHTVYLKTGILSKRVVDERTTQINANGATQMDNGSNRSSHMRNYRNFDRG